MRNFLALCLIWISQTTAVLTRDMDCEDEARPEIEETTEETQTDEVKECNSDCYVRVMFNDDNR